LRVGDKDHILIGFAWTDDDSRLRFDMFPELMAVDTTYSTNDEARVLLIICRDDGYNTSHARTSAWMPSEQRWAFDWILSDVIPSLHWPETLKRVKVLFTDQDGQLVLKVAEKQIQKQSWMKKVTHHLCAWHKLDRNLMQLSKFRSHVSDLDNVDRAKWEAIVAWLWMLVRQPETTYEGNLLFIMLDLHLSKADDQHRGMLTDSLKTELVDFVGKAFQDEEQKFFVHNFHTTMCFGKVVEVTKKLMMRFVRINCELTELASGGVIACLEVAEPAWQLAGL
jgi:hypothetical protein